MTRFILAIMLLMLLGCDVRSELFALSVASDDNKVWIFAQFNVQEGASELEPYYYYGEVSAGLLELIKHNKIRTGFILLENVRYWGDNDIIYDYRDTENTGDLVFRVENIARIKVVHTPPVIGKGYEQYEDQASVSEAAINDSQVLTDQASGAP